MELYEAENSDGEKQQVVSLIKYVQSKRGSMMWENDDPTVTKTELLSAALLSALVQSMVDAIFFQRDLRETWGVGAFNGLWGAHQGHPLQIDQPMSCLLCMRLTPYHPRDF